jgi:Fe-S-cluster-containing dehydrogenase component
MEKSLFLNIDLCSGCGACAVACMDHHDIAVEKQPALRHIHQVEDGHYPNVSIAYVSAGCMHCSESPCLIGCPTGAIRRHPTTRAVMVDQSLCIGCHSCAMACPFGIPRYDDDDKMRKCDRCSDWVLSGRDPACVRVCPLGALEYRDTNEVMQSKEAAFAGRLASSARKNVAGA